jgi:hypothetical protein
MGVGWSRRRTGASEAAVRALERRIGGELPEDYRRFVLEHDGGSPEVNELDIPGTDDTAGVNDFMSLRQIHEDLDMYSDRVPAEMIPIAFAEGGNLIMLGLRDGRVFFWDHELEDAQPLFPLAPDFGTFWRELRPFDPSSVTLKPGQVKSAWINPKLLE